MKSHKNLQPRGFRKKYFSLAAILMLNSTLIAQSQNIALNEKSSETKEQSLKLSIIHADEFVENADFKEEFSAEEIKQSNAQNVYEFLNLHSLLKITSNYGNPYTQNIDLRGFGQNAHKNLAIIVDGMRLNNIDSATISLSAIPLDSIQKIEIIRGKGTTKYGNGAVSGVLKITTTRKAGGEINLSYASYDTFNSQFFARHAGDNLNIGLYGQYQNSQGSRRISPDSDEKDGSYNKNGGITLFYYPDDSLLLRANMNYSKYGIKYANPLTKEQFDSNPTQAPISLGGDTFTHQKRWDLYHNVGLTYFANNGLVTEINFGGNRNESEYINFANLLEGKGLYGNFNSQYKNDSYLAEIGGEIKQSQRTSSTAKAQVSEILLYLNGEKYFEDSTLNLGISAQRVINQQKGDGTYSTQENLIGGELGYNYQIHPLINLFASYSRTFVTPNVDWLLRIFAPLPNTLIEPATFDTFQIGSKAVFGIHELSGNIFYIHGNDEAYLGLNKITGIYDNQTLGETRRIGGELKFTTYFSQNLFSALSYAYVDATMQGNEGYKGNTIPGVSKHTFIIGLNYLPIPNLNLGISYKYGSRAYD
ncbi:MAG TPA: TonB-dependent receptor, partial [Candidatus Scatomorpha intestinipullorum]|nr:TonB-dependent receptor [Candidatus Scatomorpha intestinipullorum]